MYLEQLESRHLLAGDLAITELMAVNNANLADEDGDFSDWIELGNLGDTPLDVGGWHLTDDPGNLNKWTLPTRMLDPGDYLVVFASGKDRAGIDGELHTDFRISGEGEYLALVAPDGDTVVFQYDVLPRQFPDVSYGLASQIDVATPLDVGHNATVFVPGNVAEVPDDWTQVGFDDSAWLAKPNGAAGPLPVGFGQPALPAPGPDRLVVNSNLTLSEGLLLLETNHRLAYEADADGGTPTTTGLTNVALATMGAIGFASSSLSPSSFGADRINDGGYGQGSVGDDANPWIASSSDNEGFVGVRFPAPQTINMMALGTRLPGRGDGTFALQYTNGSLTDVDLNDRGQIEGLTWKNIGAIESMEPDEWARQLVGFHTISDVTAIRVAITDGGTAIAELEAYNAPVGSLVSTDIADPMLHQASTALVRIPFGLDDASEVDRLLLDMQYDDGFVAYLNGSEVARGNFAGDAQFNSRADSAHSPNTIESFDLSSVTNLLRDGLDANVLAIHGLNLTASDTDFFISPRLQAIDIRSSGGVTQYFLRPSPGATNGLATEDRGPIIGQVQHGPNNVPAETEDLIVTSTVESISAPVGLVRLHYRVMYGAEPAVTMVDDGTGPDVVAGDGVFTAVIPSTSYSVGEMVRYYVTAEDFGGNTSRWPLLYDTEGQDQAAEYLGTVVDSPTVTSPLPRLLWYTPNPVPTADSVTEWSSRASIFYDGEFYDNIFVRIRGASSRTRAKKPFKLEFPEGHFFRYSDDAPRAEEINLNSTFQDKSYIREPLAYETFRLAGVPSPDSFSVRVEVNGEFFSVASLSQQIDDIFLENNGLDPEGALYKMFNGITSATSGVEKKTRRDEGNSDLAELVAGLSAGNPDRAQFVFDNIDLPAAINYMVSGIIAQDFDRGAKNFYVYRDTNGSREWTQFPFDQDLTFGNRFFSDAIAGDGSGGHGVRSHPFWGESRHNLFGTNMMIDAIIDIPETREMYLRRLRTLMDEILQTADTPVTDRYFEQRLGELETLLTADAATDLEKWGAIYGAVRDFPTAIELLRTNYLDQRRVHLFATHNIDNLDNPQLNDIAGIPHAQVNDPRIIFDHNDFDANPASGNQDEEYLKLVNIEDTAVDISGWQLRGGVAYTFAPGTVIPAGGSLYVSPNVSDFRARNTGPSGGQSLFVEGNYSGHISNLGETIELVSPGNSVRDAIVTPPMPTDNQLFFRISELHYNPAGADDLEFIELTNISGGASAKTLDLSGVSITEGPSETFAFDGGTTLGPGEFLLVVRDSAAFQAAYPEVDAALIAGSFTGALSNNGEQIKLEDAGGSTILDFSYGDNDPWPTRADGDGASLELIDVTQTPAEDTGKYYHWRASTEFGGSPGSRGVGPLGVVVNEVLSRNDEAVGGSDTIELHNTTDRSVDMSGWYLSDSADNLLKYAIPDGAALAAGQYLVLSERHFNPNPLDPGPHDFALNGAHGDDVWLVVGDGLGGVSMFVDDVHFGASASGESWGRTSGRSGRMAAMARQTLGCANLHPRVGPLVISEINYRPGVPATAALAIDANLDRDDLEFVEIYNPTGDNVSLVESRMRGGVDFDFAADASIGTGEVIVLVSFNPDNPMNADRVRAFRTQYGISNSVRLLGGFSGNLSNGSERLELQRPDTSRPDEPTFVPRLQEDEVLYDDRGTWPHTADGAGASLNRATPMSWGNDGVLWHGRDPTPGTVEFVNITWGDLTGDGAVSATDIDVLFDAIDADHADPFLDLDGSDAIDVGDAQFLVTEILQSWMGDANLDGVVDGSDFNVWNTHKLAHCEKSWSQGNFNSDRVVDGSDFNVWFDNRFSGTVAARGMDHAVVDMRQPALVPLATSAAGSADRLRPPFVLGADLHRSLALAGPTERSAGPLTSSHEPRETGGKPRTADRTDCDPGDRRARYVRVKDRRDRAGVTENASGIAEAHWPRRIGIIDQVFDDWDN